MSTFELSYGRDTRTVAIPSPRSVDVMEGRPLPTVSLDQAFEDAWAHPVERADPAEGLSGETRLAIIVNDHTRPTPTRDLLRLLWERIRTRVAAANVTVIVGTGTHRAPTEEELGEMLGEFRHTFRVLIHDCDHDLVEIGASSRGTRILLNRCVVEADRVIAIGHIGMHYYAGYSGGRKGVLPGVAGRETIAANHAQLTDPDSRACLYRGNPISDEMVDAARLINLSLVIDVVLASDGGVAKVVIGEPEAAHAVGRAFWDEHFQVPFSEPYDVVVASAGGHPKDINLYQAYKAQFNAMRALREGGILFLAAACPDGVGHAVFSEWIERSPSPDDVLALYEEEGFVLGGHKALYHARDVKRATIFLCTEMDDTLVRRFYMQPSKDLDLVLSEAREQFGESFRTLVLPHAADIFPVQSG